MSEAQETPASGEMDAEDAMREMMGFSSFTTRPKNRSETTSAHLPSQAPAVSTRSANNQDFSTGSKPTATSTLRSTELAQGQQQQMTTVPTPDIVPSFPTQQQAIYVFTSPQTGISYTKQELDEWSRGKLNDQGDKVYFKPGFVDEDPWSRLRKRGETKSNNSEGMGKTAVQKAR